MRRYQRLAVQLPVILTINSEQTPHPGTTIDIGAGGIHCTSDQILMTKTTVHVAFNIQAKRTVAAHGKIVASYFSEVNNEFRHRISFTEISNASQQMIQTYVEQELRMLAAVKMFSEPLMLTPGLSETLVYDPRYFSVTQ